MNFSISVVIPNYNGKSLLADVLPSVVIALSTLSSSSEIIVVDDNSTDDSIAFIKSNFPEIIVLKNEINLGFSGTMNKGIYAASMDLVLILNNDVKLLPGYFEDQLRFFEKPDTFGVNATVLNWDSEILQGGGKLISRHLFKIKANQNYYVTDLPTDKNAEYLSMFLGGTNALVDRKKLLQLQGYNDLFSPFYVEDVELSVRALRMGWKMYYAPASECMHQISTTITKYNKKKKIKYLTLRNKYYLHFIHLNGLTLFGWYLQTYLEIAMRLITLNGTHLKAFLTFMKTKKEAKIEKLKFQQLMALNKVPNEALFDIINNYKAETLARIQPKNN